MDINQSLSEHLVLEDVMGIIKSLPISKDFIAIFDGIISDKCQQKLIEVIAMPIFNIYFVDHASGNTGISTDELFNRSYDGLKIMTEELGGHMSTVHPSVVVDNVKSVFHSVKGILRKYGINNETKIDDMVDQTVWLLRPYFSNNLEYMTSYDNIHQQLVTLFKQIISQLPLDNWTGECDIIMFSPGNFSITGTWHDNDDRMIDLSICPGKDNMSFYRFASTGQSAEKFNTSDGEFFLHANLDYDETVIIPINFSQTFIDKVKTFIG